MQAVWGGGTAQPLRENNQRRRFRTVAATPRFTSPHAA